MDVEELSYSSLIATYLVYIYLFEALFISIFAPAKQHLALFPWRKPYYYRPPKFCDIT